MRLSAFLLGSMVLTAPIAACRHSSPVSAPAPTFAPLAPLANDARLLQDDRGGIRDSLQSVIRDQAGLREVWQRVTGSQTNVPAVDFTQDMVVVVAAGRMSPGDEIHVDSAGVRRESTATGQQQNVLAVIYTVSEACPKLSGDAFPVEIVRIRRNTSPVRFTGRRMRGAGCHQ